MSSEVTAGIMIGPITSTSTNGQPNGLPGGRTVAPSHVLVLMENARATWIVQRCPNLQRPEPTRRIQPSSPAHLLAAALLGYTALVKPDAVAASPRLAALVSEPPRDGIQSVGLIDEDTAAHIYDHCAEHVYAVVTWLPGSTIQQRELDMAAAAGMAVAMPAGRWRDRGASRQ